MTLTREQIEKTMFVFNRDKGRIFGEAERFVNLYHKADGDSGLHKMYGEDLKSEAWNMALLIQEMHHLLERLERVIQPQPSTWKPIETAPKDWTDILLAIHDTEVDEYTAMCVGYYSMLDGGDDCWYMTNAGRVKVAPTHWMPLPITTPETKEK